MTWYAAHAIMYVKFKDSVQDKYPVWENIILIEAQSDEEAFRKAEERAKEDEGDSKETFTWQGRPATWIFAGIRKLVDFESPTDGPKDGMEVTYLQMEVDTEESLTKLVNGESVTIRYEV